MVLLQVSLLGRLHHRNLVNLVGYCVDKGQHMLIYEFMSNGSLSNLLYSKFRVPCIHNPSCDIAWYYIIQIEGEKLQIYISNLMGCQKHKLKLKFNKERNIPSLYVAC